MNDTHKLTLFVGDGNPVDFLSGITPIVCYCGIMSWRKHMGLTTKPVTIHGVTFLKVPSDVAELLRVMATKICSVNFRIDEKECQLIYSFAKSVPDLEEVHADPRLVLAS